MVWSETNIIRERSANRRTRDTALTQLTLGTLFNKKAGKELKQMLKKVADSD